VALHFKPSAGGAQDASLFAINGNQSQPVTNIGMNGYGVEPSSLGQKSSGTTSGTVAPDTTPPAVSGYGLTNSTFVVDGVPTPFFGFAAAKKRSRGTTFEYRLSEAGFVNITITQSRPGRRRNKACLAPSRSLRRAKKCTRITTLGTLTRVSYHGINRIAFSGRLGTSALKPGRYQATLTATDAARNASKPKTISFTIVRR
jgi:hypothetical protein